jgi:hypothetical protein
MIDARGEAVSLVQGIWQERKITPELTALLSKISG